MSEGLVPDEIPEGKGKLAFQMASVLKTRLQVGLSVLHLHCPAQRAGMSEGLAPDEIQKTPHPLRAILANPHTLSSGSSKVCIVVQTVDHYLHFWG